MRVETGTTNERLARCGIMALALCVFAAWFAYDGWHRYGKKARESLRRGLEEKGIQVEELPPPHPKLSFNYPEEHEAEFREKVREGWTQEEVLDEFGPPAFKYKEPATKRDSWHYIGTFCRLTLDWERHGTGDAIKVDKAHIEQVQPAWRYESIQQQKFFAVVCGVLGLIGVVWFLKVYRTHVVADDEGLTYDRLRIPYDAMVDLDPSDYPTKGWLVLRYTQGDSERQLKLDPYKIDDFEGIVDVLCEKRGFPNPIPVDVYGQPEDAEEEHADGAEAASPSVDEPPKRESDDG